jgi:hypothetical protein
MALLLLLAATPALSEIRPDQALTPAIIGAAASNQNYARVASDGTNFFTVWRTNSSNLVVIGAGRVSPSDELLDRPSILIAPTSSDRQLGVAYGRPDVVFVGGVFLVAYPSGTSIVTRRFYRNGQPVDPPKVIENATMPAGLATNGETVFLATATKRFRLLAADGTPLGPERDIPNGGIGAYSVASNGDRYLIAYAFERRFVLLSRTGDLIAAKPIPDTAPNRNRGNEQAVTAISNGSSFLIALAHTGPISCVSVDADGNAGEAHEVDKTDTQNIVSVWSGNEYTLFWSANTGMASGKRVDSAGVPLDANAITVASGTPARPTTVLASASDGRETLVITQSSNCCGSADWHTEAAIFDSLPQIDAQPANRRHAAIASAAAEQASPSIASNGTSSLVTWRERAGLNQTVIRAAFVDSNGGLGRPIEIGEASSQTRTATASNGTDFLISYFDAQSVLAIRRVTLEGGVDFKATAVPSSIGPNSGIAIGWTGQLYVVMTPGNESASDLRSYSYTSATLFSIVWPDGTLKQTWTAFAEPVCCTVRDTPAIQCGATGCTATWHTVDYRNSGYRETDTLVLTDAAGTSLSESVIATGIGVITPAFSIRDDAGRSLFAYSHLSDGMFAGRITPGGVVDTASVRVIPPGGNSFHYFLPRPVGVVYNGFYFIQEDDSAVRLYWTRIEPEPKPHVSTIFDLNERVTLPVTLTASARNTYVVYTGGEDDTTLMAPRLFLRTLSSPDPQPSPVRRRAAR